MSCNPIVTQEEYDLLNRLYLDHKHKYETSNFEYIALKKEYNELEEEYNKLFDNFQYIADIVVELQKEKDELNNISKNDN